MHHSVPMNSKAFQTVLLETDTFSFEVSNLQSTPILVSTSPQLLHCMSVMFDTSVLFLEELFLGKVTHKIDRS